MTASEQLLSAFSQMYFFEELVQDNLQFSDQKGNSIELADLILNLGDVVVAIQVKERTELSQTNDIATEMKWFSNKMHLAKKQVKNTVEVIKNGGLPAFRNKRGVEKSIDAEAEIIPLVVFVNNAIVEYPHVLGKHSEDGLTVNCMSLHDFQEMCNKLISPAEIVDYLNYRCSFYESNGSVNLLITDVSETDLLITRPTANEALISQFLLEKYGMDELKRGTEQFELFRWFVQQTAIRSTAGRDDPATYAILLFLAHFHRDEIRAFWDRLILARDKAQCHDYDIAGSLRRENEYAIFFVAAPPMQALPMEYLLEKARKKCEPKVLLQVYVWWEDEENYRIDYMLWDCKTNSNV